jgi:hypothetical protein
MTTFSMRLLLLTALVTATGCSGGAVGSGGSTVCPAIAYPSPTLVSPANGATNVSASIGTLQINGQTNSSVLVTLTPSSGTTLTQTDSVVPVAGSGLNASLSIPALATKTMYTVALTDLGQCGFLRNTTIGSFTTQ